jgi:RNA polymerase sigma-70 factor (ECF subfamily)
VSPRAPAPSLRIVARAPANDTDDEGRLVAELRHGRLDALAHAYDRWHARVRVLARRLLGDDAAAEDVVQEVFSALPRAAGRYRGDGGLGAFLMGMAVKRARHHRRAALRRRRALERWGATARLGGAGPADPERDAYRRQLGERLARALDRLPHAQRVAFVLCDVEGLTAGEVASIADAPEATVRTRAFHARRKLRDLLAAEHDE